MRSLRSIDCRPIRPLNPPILGDFEAKLAQKSPRLGGWGASVRIFETSQTSPKDTNWHSSKIIETATFPIDPEAKY